MLVKNWMSKPVISADVTDTIKTANILLAKHKIRSLPVLENGKLVGIVTDRDLKRVSISDNAGLEEHELIYMNTRIKVGEIMTKNPIVISPNLTMEQVAKVLYSKKISGLPVVDDSGRLVGMISQGDVFRLLISVTGIEDKGLQIAIQIKDESGSIKEIADIIRSFGGRVRNLLTSYENVPDGFRNVYFKTSQLDSTRLDDFISELRGKGKLRYILDYPGDNKEAKVLLMEIT